jgi:hypothetical protein
LDPWEVEASQSWKSGHVRVYPLSGALISYTAGYCAKKVGFQEAREERVDWSTGELYFYQPPFLQMSRGGRTSKGIGHEKRQFWREFSKTVIWQGREFPAPRYLKDEYLRNASPEEIESLKSEVHAKVVNRLRRESRFPSVVRAAEKAMTLSRHAESSAKRSL